ncbi:MAG: hypothetical protein AB7G35_21945 [Hyphomicrobiaceae bacterium]
MMKHCLLLLGLALGACDAIAAEICAAVTSSKRGSVAGVPIEGVTAR